MAAGLEIHVREALHERAFANSEDDDFMAVWKRPWEDFDYALTGCETKSRGSGEDRPGDPRNRLSK